MKFTGENQIKADRQAVWQALNDADVLKASIPGAQDVIKVADDEFTATVQAKVGPVRATFKGRIKLDNIDPPNGYTITGEGSGGAAGFAKGSAKVSLSEGASGGTLLAYDVDAQVGGKLAQIGQRLIQGTAKKMSDDFFANFAARVEGGGGEPGGVEAQPQAGQADGAAAGETAGSRGEERIFGLPRQQALIIAGAVAALVLAYAIMS